MATVTSTGRAISASIDGDPADGLQGFARLREFYHRFRLRHAVPTAAALTLVAWVTRAHLSGEAYA